MVTKFRKNRARLSKNSEKIKYASIGSGNDVAMTLFYILLN
ncbi:MAG TPA: hypothetical protein VLD84_08985 [Nitrososphaeraceae archaeon]|nr:hypothetical protein [Nitrososphaeraceae archaeon]